MKYPKAVLIRPQPKLTKGAKTLNIPTEKLVGFEAARCGFVNDTKSSNVPAILVDERLDGNLEGKSLWLNRNYDWHIVEDSLGCPVLICLKKD